MRVIRLSCCWAVLAAAAGGGCDKPVVFQPLSEPKVQKADMPPEGAVVRTFVGHTRSQSEAFGGREAPAVAVVTSGREAGRGMCRFVFFVDGMAVTIALPLRGPLDSGRIEVKGKAWDPRGWDVEWTASLEAGIVDGTFKQPHDHGVFRLREVR